MREKLIVAKRAMVKWYITLTNGQKYLFYLLTFNVIGSIFNLIVSHHHSSFFEPWGWAIFMLFTIGCLYRFIMLTFRKQRVVKFG